MSLFPLKPASTHIKKYYAALAQFHLHGHTTEGNTRSAFADLLKRCTSPYGWHLVEEYQFKGTAKQSLRADGALVDDLTLVHGIWEAKDSDDDLEKEITAKRAKGYPLTNILFQSPAHAVLYQDSRIAFNGSIITPEALVEVLELFTEHRQAHEVDWEDAVTKFAEKIPDLARGVTTILEAEDKKNATFRENFQSFAELCRQSINPDLTDDAIRKMLVQHLLTERIFRKVFNNQEFLSRNVIAAEIEKVIRSITARHFSRDEFLKPLDRFYTAIEKAAESQQGYTEKQHFLNAVYEKFFQRFDTKQADTMGIVYTPQPIVDFMVRSVDEILRQEFGKTLSDSGVHILDPFTGTGNFITRIMQQIKRSALPQKYSEELHCNEIMLLPYYIASMNIEHAYVERLEAYRTFDGICLVDTFDLTDSAQVTLFSAENTARVARQRAVPITVVLANPPYNAGQKDENDGNSNQKYEELDDRVRKTYVAKSKATLTNSLSDPYVKAFRWATDRLTDRGIICYITNSSFLDGIAFDGMRQQLAMDFDAIYVIDLGGDVRANPKLSGTTHNVFGIQVGVAITLLVKREQKKKQGIGALINYARMPENDRRGQKEARLTEWQSVDGVPWTRIRPNARHRWLSVGEARGYEDLMPLGVKRRSGEEIFESYSNGPKSNNDAYVYSFSKADLTERANAMAEAFNGERDRWMRARRPKNVTAFLKRDLKTIKWIRKTKKSIGRDKPLDESEIDVRTGLYRPFTMMFYNFTRVFNEDVYSFPRYMPTAADNNVAVCLSGIGSKKMFSCLAARLVPGHDLIEKTQCFCFYNHDKKTGKPVENITDWALAEFRTHYADNKITKWDIFHATYAVLHHPEYRIRYAANLKRELPRIPFPPDFHAFAAAGKRLMELHIDYEKQPEYPLEQIEDPKAEVTFRVERMRLNAKDKSELRYNDFLTLRGIPLAAFDYRLGNRSALEWIIDQYRVSTDTRSGIVNDPNREGDPHYILRLIGQVITVSLETQQIIAALPSLQLGETSE